MVLLKSWDKLPSYMQTDEVRPYYEILKKKRMSLIIKRVFDIVLSLFLFVILFIPMCVISVMIKVDSKGPIFYRQERVTVYGKKFKIHKFRTMVVNADKIGSTVTVDSDSRITKVGKMLRDLRLDEIPQVIDVLSGNMSFVGTRPEAVKYVNQYKPEMYATLLLPAGITSECSIRYKDEYRLLNCVDNVDEAYVNNILPNKMLINLDSIKNFSFYSDIVTMLRTVFAVLGKEYK